MASVFLARDLQLDRLVAIKMLHPQFAVDESFAERFRREARAAASLSHHNIIAIYDWGRQGDNYFIVMEYVEGQSLMELLADRGRMNPDAALGVGIGVSAALAFAHQNGIIHRDIKPGNVLVSSQGRIKVADFGIATVTGGGLSNLTQAGMVVGTAAYISPEQARGAQVDARSDLYSLGVVIYETLTGRPLFEGDSAASLAYQHARKRPKPLGEAGVQVPQELESATMRLLAKNPAERYNRAEDVLEHLRHIREKVKNKSARSTGKPSSDQRKRTPSAERSRRSSATAPQRRRRVGTEHLRASGQPPGYSQRNRKTRKRGGDTTVYLERQRRSGMFYAGFAVLIVTLIVLVVVLFNVLRDGGTADAPSANLETVPSVFELQRDEAVRTLENAGFVVKLTYQENTRTAEGAVSSQTPPGGSRAEVGSTVTLTVSSGAGSVPVPSLVGLTATAALGLLSDLGLEGIATEVTSDQPKGEVVSQQPVPESKIEMGESVFLDISSGPANILVPEVKGRPRDNARADLEAAGFVVVMNQENSEDAPRDRATRTVPPAGTPHTPGNQILLYISLGPSVMPNLVGEDLRAATTRLDEWCENCYTTRIRTTLDETMIGRVLEQTPAPGVQLATETEVVLYIGALESVTTTQDEQSTSEVDTGAPNGGESPPAELPPPPPLDQN